MLTVHTDGSVRGKRAGFAFVAGGRKSCGHAATTSAFAAELLAVIAALSAYPADDVEIVCDNIDVRNGIEGRRYRLSFEPAMHVDLWAEFDRLAVGRVVTTRQPRRKNKDQHGEAHRMARAAAKTPRTKCRTVDAGAPS